MGMFHHCKFPIFNGAGVVETEFVIRDGVYQDIWHDLVPNGVRLIVEDWSTDDYALVVLCKRHGVWVKTDDKDAPHRLPDEYYRAVQTVADNMAARLRLPYSLS